LRKSWRAFALVFATMCTLFLTGAGWCRFDLKSGGKTAALHIT
jgi:hypothetical protein